ncbi:hypothetical protein KAJ27_14825 [bacterium]|nr:hypothetical protein [bacterium]
MDNSNKFAGSITTVICEDVRQEINNKLSLMGVFNGTINIDIIPCVLPVLHFVVFFTDLKKKINKLYLSLDIPNSDPIFLENNIPPPPANEKNFNLIVGISPFVIKSPGECSLTIRTTKKGKPIFVQPFKIMLNKKKPSLSV